MTVQCARCHQHKFDPISQRDYYRMQAVFAGVGRAERPFDADPKIAAQRRQLARRKRLLDENPAANPFGPEEAGRRRRRPGEVGRARRAPATGTGRCCTGWRRTPTPAPSSPSSPDGSYRCAGPRPERDTYRFTTVLPAKDITAVRVEVLTDPSLPHGGPGRQDNGNLHLSEFQVEGRAAARAGSPRRHPARRPGRRLQPGRLGHHPRDRRQTRDRLGHLSAGRQAARGDLRAQDPDRRRRRFDPALQPRTTARRRPSHRPGPDLDLDAAEAGEDDAGAAERACRPEDRRGQADAGADGPRRPALSPGVPRGTDRRPAEAGDGVGDRQRLPEVPQLRRAEGAGPRLHPQTRRRQAAARKGRRRGARLRRAAARRVPGRRSAPGGAAPGRAGEVAHRSGKHAHLAQHRQPGLALSLR